MQINCVIPQQRVLCTSALSVMRFTSRRGAILCVLNCFLYLLSDCDGEWALDFNLGFGFGLPAAVEAKLSFVAPGRRWAYSPSPSKAPGISYQGTMKTSVRMLKPQEVSNCYMVLLSVSSGASVGRQRVSSLFEPWLVRLSTAKSWVLAEGFPRGDSLPNVPSFTPVHNQ